MKRKINKENFSIYNTAADDSAITGHKDLKQDEFLLSFICYFIRYKMLVYKY